MLTLCELNGLSLPELRQAYQDLAQDQRRERRVLDHVRSAQDGGDLLDDLGLPLRLALRCNQCRYEYTYEVEYALLAHDFFKKGGPTQEATSFDRLIVCKRCGAVEDYELGTGAHLALIAEFMRWDLRPKDEKGTGEPDPLKQEGRLRFVKGLSAAGREFGNASAALRHLLETSRRRPDDADIFKRLGNFYRNGGLAQAAMQAYERALALDPGEMEAHYNMGRMLLQEKSWEKAREHLRRVLELGKNRKFPKPQRRDFCRSALDGLAEIQEKAGLPLFPAAPADAAGGGLSVRVESLDLESDEAIDRVIEMFAKP